MNFVENPEITTAFSEEKADKERLPVEIAKKLEAYQVAWNTTSEDSSGSMPIGNGDITANVWVETDGNLYYYIGKTDTWSEATRLLKVGKVKVHITPNPFAGEDSFVQTLKLGAGEIVINGGSAGSRITLRIWVDAYHPVIRLEAYGEQNFDIQVSSEIWRGQPYKITEQKEPMQANNWNFFYSPVSAPTESADVLVEKENGIEWYHRNEESPYKDILTYENAGEFFRAQEDPYQNRTFGAYIQGDGLKKENKSTLKGTAQKSYTCLVYAYTEITDTVQEWENGLMECVESDETIETARQKHQAWWEAFWNRSWIFIEGDEAAETVTRGYLMQRYLQAIQGRGAYPIKFNGGAVTFDYRGENADHRNWGAPYWFQNTRLLYWNMLAAGDFDMMLPFFNMYRDALELQMKITKKYYGHEGAFFPETTNIFGGYTLMDYYWNDLTEHKDEDFLRETAVPFAEQIVLFYDQHFGRNEEGHLQITPTHSLETYWDDVSNPTEQIAGLRAVVGRLLSLSEQQISGTQRAEWERFYGELPEIPEEKDDEKSYIKVAEEYGPHRYNYENPELYTVFPYKLYGVGKERLDTAINTYRKRISTFNYCWSQNGIHAAYLGQAEDAKAAVLSHFSNTAADVRFPGFWEVGNDWMPDLDNGGSAMSALQAMLVQCDGDKVKLLPAWPAKWSVDCKLHATDKKTVRIKYGTEK